MTATYSEKLDFDRQITSEEQIASFIFDSTEVSEEMAAKLSRDILKLVLEEFRSDLFETV